MPPRAPHEIQFHAILEAAGAVPNRDRLSPLMAGSRLESAPTTVSALRPANYQKATPTHDFVAQPELRSLFDVHSSDYRIALCD